MNKRQLNLVKYGISGKRYKELCGFCEQYPEWKVELQHNNDTVKGIEVSDMPTCSKNIDVTANLAIRRSELQKKCQLIEKTAAQADSYLAKYIIDSVCYEVPVTYLIAVNGMPVSKAAFYDARRYFFYLLDQNKKM